MTPLRSSPTTWAPPKKVLAALKIEWDDGPHAKLTTAAVAAELEKATLGPGAVAQNIGDAEAALARAAQRIDATYQIPFLAHAAMEPMNCTVHARKDGCEIWVGSQAIARAQAGAAKTLGLPLEKVVLAQSSPRRRVRPAAGGGWRGSRGADRAPRGRPGEGRMDPRGRYPARHVPALLVRPHLPPGSMKKECRSPGRIGSRVPRSLRAGFRRGSRTASTRTRPRGAIDLPYALPNFHVEYLRVEPPGIPDRFLAQRRALS